MENDITILNLYLSYIEENNLHRCELSKGDFKILKKMNNLSGPKASYIKKVLLEGSDDDIKDIISGKSSIHKVMKSLNPSQKRTGENMLEFLLNHYNTDSTINEDSILVYTRIFFNLYVNKLINEEEYDKSLSILMNKLNQISSYDRDRNNLKNKLLKCDLLLSNAHTDNFSISKLSALS